MWGAGLGVSELPLRWLDLRCALDSPGGGVRQGTPGGVWAGHEFGNPRHIRWMELPGSGEIPFGAGREEKPLEPLKPELRNLGFSWGRSQEAVGAESGDRRGGVRVEKAPGDTLEVGGRAGGTSHWAER